MTAGMDPQVAGAMALANQFYSALSGQMYQLNTQTFTATDEAETVEVTLNGHQWLTRLHIEDGLLRLGAETVEQRINEALQKAQAAASEAGDARGAQLTTGLADIARAVNERLA